MSSVSRSLRPEVSGMTDPLSNKLELHNTWLVSHNTVILTNFLLITVKSDATKPYLDWAVKQGFGIIDVNIPKYLTGLEVGQRALTYDQF